MKCSLCGKEFEYSAAVCAGCPFHKACELIRCPNCGYEFPKESKIVEFIKKLFRQKPSPDNGAGRKIACPEKM